MRLLIPEYSNQFVLRYNSVYRQGFRGVQLLLFLKIAVLVSRSGGVISTDNPHAKRETNRSGNVGISFGKRSLVKTICLLFR